MRVIKLTTRIEVYNGIVLYQRTMHIQLYSVDQSEPVVHPCVSAWPLPTSSGLTLVGRCKLDPGLKAPWIQRFKLMKRNFLSTCPFNLEPGSLSLRHYTPALRELSLARCPLRSVGPHSYWL